MQTRVAAHHDARNGPNGASRVDAGYFDVQMHLASCYIAVRSHLIGIGGSGVTCGSCGGGDISVTRLWQVF